MLKKFFLSNFNTILVTNMKGIYINFGIFKKLENLYDIENISNNWETDIFNFNASKVTDIYIMLKIIVTYIW